MFGLFVCLRDLLFSMNLVLLCIREDRDRACSLLSKCWRNHHPGDEGMLASRSCCEVLSLGFLDVLILSYSFFVLTWKFCLSPSYEYILMWAGQAQIILLSFVRFNAC